MSDLVLELRNICKRFGQTNALTDLSLSISSGSIHALLGVNGAGKSTLVKILSGLYTPDSGSIFLNSKPVTITTPDDAVAAGIGTVQQHPELFDSLSGAENIFLGTNTSLRNSLKKYKRNEYFAAAKALQQRYPLPVDLTLRVGLLNGVQRECVAILRALQYSDIKVLLLDEPTSTLTLDESQALFHIMRLLRNSGVAVIFITHRLDEVLTVCDSYTVLRDGRHIETKLVSSDPDAKTSIIQAMLQAELSAVYPSARAIAPINDTPTLELKGITYNQALRDISFSLHRGEILGGFGLADSGLTELADILFGVRHPTRGTISLHGVSCTIDTPKRALEHRIFLLPGDRKTQGLFLSRDVVFNSAISNEKRTAGLLRYIRRGHLRDTITELANQLELRPLLLNRAARDFSGGNQQKIVLAKGLYTNSEIYVFLEPTVGVDVGARAKIYDVIRRISSSAAVLLLSSDSDEVCGLSDRVFTICQGVMTIAPTIHLNRAIALAGGVAKDASNATVTNIS